MKPVYILVLAFTATAFCPVPPTGRQLLPRDEAPNDASFAEFRVMFLSALEDGDYKEVARHTSTEIQIFNDGEPGRKELIRVLKEQDLASDMKRALNAGGAFYKEEGMDPMFVAPSFYTDFPDGSEWSDHAVVYGTDVNIRSKADLRSKVIAQLSYEIVSWPEFDPQSCASGSRHTWYRIILADGRAGYLSGDFLWSGGTRAPSFHFRKVDTKWRLEIISLSGC